MIDLCLSIMGYDNIHLMYYDEAWKIDIFVYKQEMMLDDKQDAYIYI